MAKLTTKARKKIPTDKFALERERKYPIEDRAHAANAKARAQQQFDKGNMSKGTLSKIDAAANKVLKKDNPHKESKMKSGHEKEYKMKMEKMKKEYKMKMEKMEMEHKKAKAKYAAKPKAAVKKVAAKKAVAKKAVAKKAVAKRNPY